MSKPKILFVSYTSDWTGPTNSLSHLLKYLREQYEVAVVLPRQGLFSEALEREGIRYFSLPSMNKWSVLSIHRIIRQQKFDLVYGNNRQGSSRNALIAAKLARVPFILHVREMGWNYTSKSAGFMRFADAVIAVSQACAVSNARFVSKDKMYIVYNGIIPPSNSMEREAARHYLLRETGLPAESIIITNIGHINRRKGQEYALEAMAKLKEEIPTAHLLLVGKLDRDQEYLDKIQTIIQQNHLGQHVSVMGFRQDAYQLLQGSDLYLHPSIEDSHPRSVLEAMMAELPVVAFATDGVTETVVEGQTGYLVPPRDVPQMLDAVRKLIHNAPLRTQMGQAGKRHVEERFTAEVTARQVKAVIDRILVHDK